MKNLTRPEIFENELSSMVRRLFYQFGIASILKRNGAYKEAGFPAATIFRRFFSLAFAGGSMFMMLKMGVWDDIGKNTFYRFIKSSSTSSINWLRLQEKSETPRSLEISAFRRSLGMWALWQVHPGSPDICTKKRQAQRIPYII